MITNIQDLHIGCYYRAKSPEKIDWQDWYELKASDILMWKNGEIHLDRMPITKENLIKLGFNNYYTKDDNIMLRPLDKGFYAYRDKTEFVCTLEHMHELQLLYKLLYGNNLTVKKKLTLKATVEITISDIVGKDEFDIDFENNPMKVWNELVSLDMNHKVKAITVK